MCRLNRAKSLGLTHRKNEALALFRRSKKAGQNPVAGTGCHDFLHRAFVALTFLRNEEPDNITLSKTAKVDQRYLDSLVAFPGWYLSRCQGKAGCGARSGGGVFLGGRQCSLFSLWLTWLNQSILLLQHRQQDDKSPQCCGKQEAPAQLCPGHLDTPLPTLEFRCSAGRKGSHAFLEVFRFEQVHHRHQNVMGV